MNRRVEILRIINDILIVFVVTGVAFIGMGASANFGLFIGIAVLSLYVIVSELILAFAGNLIMFLLLHLGAGALLCGITKIYYEKLLVGLEIGGIPLSAMIFGLSVLEIVIITILAIYTKVDGNARFYPAMAEAILFIALLILCKIIKNRDAEFVVLLGELLWGVLAVIYYNARQTIGALVTFKDRDFVPYDAIRKNNSLLLKVSVVVTLLAMLLCTLFDYGAEIVSFIKNVFINILTWIFSFFNFEETDEAFEVKENAPVSSEFQDFLPRSEDNSIMHTIWNVLFWIVAILVTLLFIYLVLKLIKEFYKMFNSSQKGIRDRLRRDKVEYLNPFESRKESVNARKKKDELGFAQRLSKNGRIRYMFRKYIREGRGFADIKISSTPYELEKISLADEINKTAYEIYERARYSEHEITSEDISEMKKRTVH
ncbi:MAG: hypothetical protein IJR29_05075 [Butyrivibrio sp.]|nr:hypothetical protein [Butyrivibrio sp.]